MQPPLGIDAFLQGKGALLDVRTPSEFAQGHIPAALNLPLFTDAERAEVGTLYKQAGRQLAVRRGLALVGSRLDRLADQLLAIQARQPEGPLRLHCWRGGLRSSSVAWLASTLDLPVVVLDGGYKAYRHWVLACTERPWPLRLLGGRTGTGKTELLQALAARGVAVIDLEGLAHHRGSSFGGLGLPAQPSSEQFENRLAAVLRQHEQAPEIWLEAESAQVGRCRIPAGLWRQMKAAPLLEVRRPLEERLRHLVAIYGHQDPAALVEATLRISKRLGPQRTAAAVEAIGLGQMERACAQMLDYYDRCYDRETTAHAVTAVDLGTLAARAAADQLLRQGLVQAP
ncbi:MAG: tRNA 2-selenouridine(34) synthase MnmH [Cyanobacteriota bacterium]